MFNRRPFALADLIFRYAGLQTSLIGIRPRVSDILVAVGLGKEQSQADAPRHLGIRRIKTLSSCDSDTEIDDILEWRIGFLRIRGRRLHDVEECGILVEQRLIVGIEIGGRNPEFVWSSNFCRQNVSEVLLGTEHVISPKVERLPRQAWQLLF